jgi:flagellar M-ring protein FliF
VGLTNAQLKAQSQIEQYLETKAQAVVAQIVGPSNATIRVAADLNFDQIARTVQAVDPNQSALVSEDRAEITPGDEAQGAGSLQTSSAFETTRTVETVSRGGARVDRLTVAVVVADRRMEAADGRVTLEPRTAAELRQIELLVGNAVGFSAPRGDQISVMSAPVEQARPEVFTDAERDVDYAGIVMAAQRPFIAFVALTVAFLIALRVLKTLRLAPASPRPGSGTQDLRLEASGDATAGGSVPLGASRREAVEAAAPPRAELKLQDPEMTAKVLRSWMRDS